MCTRLFSVYLLHRYTDCIFCCLWKINHQSRVVHSTFCSKFWCDKVEQKIKLLCLWQNTNKSNCKNSNSTLKIYSCPLLFLRLQTWMYSLLSARYNGLAQICQFCQVFIAVAFHSFDMFCYARGLTQESNRNNTVLSQKIIYFYLYCHSTLLFKDVPCNNTLVWICVPLSLLYDTRDFLTPLKELTT